MSIAVVLLAVALVTALALLESSLTALGQVKRLLAAQHDLIQLVQLHNAALKQLIRLSLGEEALNPNIGVTATPRETRH